MDSKMSPCTIAEIVTADDPNWQTWKKIYYAGFPESERMSEGHFLRVMEDKAKGEAPYKHILALFSDKDKRQPIGLAYYEDELDANIAFLWYVATISTERNQGYGTYLYREICKRAQEKGLAMLVYEVEIPELAAQNSVEDEEFAARRVAWYQRQGAYVLDGVHYVQSVDTGVPPIEMWLMVQPFSTMNAEQVFSICKISCGDSLTQIGELALRGIDTAA